MMFCPPQKSSDLERGPSAGSMKAPGLFHSYRRELGNLAKGGHTQVRGHARTAGVKSSAPAHLFRGLA